MVAGRADSLRQARRDQIDRQHRAHHRHEGEPGRERRQPVDALEIQAEDEDQAVEGHVDEKADQRRQRKHADARTATAAASVAARASPARRTASPEPADATKPAITNALLQPSEPPSMMAPARQPSAAMAAIWPGRSISRCGDRVVSLAKRQVSHRPARPIGRLTRKIERQPTSAIRPPPTSGPAVSARLAPAAQIADRPPARLSSA